MRFSDIRQITQARYKINVPWDYLLVQLGNYTKEYRLELNPYFQRGYVWNMEQQQRYIEYILSGGLSGREILFNFSGWNSRLSKEEFCKRRMVCVDGLQRLTSVIKFLNNEVRAFGSYLCEFDDRVPNCADFIFYVNDIESEEEVLQWYIDFNSGGTVHTKEEIDKVKRMLIKRRSK